MNNFPVDLSEVTEANLKNFFKKHKFVFSGSEAEDRSKRLIDPKKYFYVFQNGDQSVTIILREYETSRSAYLKPNRFEVSGKTKEVLYSCSFSKFGADMKNYIEKILNEI